MLFLEDVIKSMDDLLISMRLTVDDELMLLARDAGQVVVMLLREAIIPTGIPVRQSVRIFLIRVRELSTSQSLHIDKAILVHIGIEPGRSQSAPRKGTIG